MLTLTVPHARRMDEAYLRQQCELVADVWRETMSRLRWYAYRRARGDAHAADRVMPPSRYGRPNRRWSSTWRRGQWDATATSGMWIREISTGSAAHRGWHVHVHVLVESREAAELVNAAWQRAYAHITGDERWTSTDITTISGEAASRYVAKYVSKGDIPSDPALHGVYVRGSRHFRRCDAWGDMRPLGIGSSSGDVTHIGRPGWRYLVDVATYYGEDDWGRWMRTGVPPVSALDEHPQLSWLIHDAPSQDDLNESRELALLIFARDYPDRVVRPPPLPA